MTVCVAAMCANRDGEPNKFAIVASDRMVTLGGITEFEHEVPKLKKITQRAVALIAGDAIRGSKLINDVASSFQVEPPRVEEISGRLAGHYLVLRDQHIEIEIFRPRGFNREQFYQHLQQRLLPQMALGLDQEAMSYNYGVECLLAGVDELGSHLFYIGNPGGLTGEYGQIGFHAIGSGALHAMHSMIGFRHMGGRSIDETIFSVYASKRRAEVAPGVGSDTDMGIITDDGFYLLNQTSLDSLNAIYQDYQKPVTDKINKKIGELNLLGEGNHNEKP